MSLRNQTFFCILVPIVIIYYTKLTLEDYIKSLFSKHFNEETREEIFHNENSNSENFYKSEKFNNTFYCNHAGGQQ